jgi:uncharacterized protein
MLSRQRARYRKSLQREEPVKLGEIGRYEFRTFTFIARRTCKGSRLQMAITSPNSIFAEKNYNAGGLVTHESGKDARTAHVKLYHDGKHPSILDLLTRDQLSAHR